MPRHSCFAFRLPVFDSRPAPSDSRVPILSLAPRRSIHTLRNLGLNSRPPSRPSTLLVLDSRDYPRHIDVILHQHSPHLPSSLTSHSPRLPCIRTTGLLSWIRVPPLLTFSIHTMPRSIRQVSVSMSTSGSSTSLYLRSEVTCFAHAITWIGCLPGWRTAMTAIGYVLKTDNR